MKFKNSMHPVAANAPLDVLKWSRPDELFSLFPSSSLVVQPTMNRICEHESTSSHPDDFVVVVGTWVETSGTNWFPSSIEGAGSKRLLLAEGGGERSRCNKMMKSNSNVSLFLDSHSAQKRPAFDWSSPSYMTHTVRRLDRIIPKLTIAESIRKGLVPTGSFLVVHYLLLTRCNARLTQHQMPLVLCGSRW